MAGGHGQLPPRAWLTIEALHAGSLIIDDIEDESRYRRGKPALHCTYGVPVAINTGNWLYFWAEQLCSSLGLSAVSELELRRTLTRSVLGCHYGQALDLSTRVTTLAQRDVFEVVQVITRLKTGSLTELSAATGAIVAGAEPGCVRALTDFGRALGIGLQMLDDVSGIYQEARCHKGHEDLIHARATWPFAWLAESLDEVGFSRLQHRAREVEQHDVHPELVARQMRDALGSSPRERVSLYLASALNDLRKVVGDSQAFRALSHDVERLEHSYG
jgi:geranylgeranyl pyrophosphate synthase